MSTVLSSSPARGAPTLPSKRPPSVSQLQIPHTPPPHPPPLPPRMDSPSLPSSFTSSPMHISPTASTSTSSPPNLEWGGEFTELPPIKLYHTKEQRELSEQLADLYSLLVTIEHVETAYVRDAISNTKDYTQACNRLLAQYKTLREALGKDAPELAAFCASLGVPCKAAINRIRTGVPATMVHGGMTMEAGGGASLVFRAAQAYITVLDALKLGMKAVDQLVPLLTDAMSHVNQMTDMPPEHEARVPLRHWLVLMSGMRAHEELTLEQARQCEFDLQKAYDAVYRFLEERDKRHHNMQR